MSGLKPQAVILDRFAVVLGSQLGANGSLGPKVLILWGRDATGFDRIAASGR